VTTKPVGKTTIILGAPLNKAVNDYRATHPKEGGDLQTKTWVIIELLKKGLAAEGLQVAEA